MSYNTDHIADYTKSLYSLLPTGDQAKLGIDLVRWAKYRWGLAWGHRTLPESAHTAQLLTKHRVLTVCSLLARPVHENKTMHGGAHETALHKEVLTPAPPHHASHSMTNAGADTQA